MLEMCAEALPLYLMLVQGRRALRQLYYYSYNETSNKDEEREDVPRRPTGIAYLYGPETT